MSDGSTGGRRPTKAERKEQARLEREELQRKAAKRTRMRALGVGLVAAALALAVALAVVLQPDDVDLPDRQELLAQADQAIVGGDPPDHDQKQNDGDADGDVHFRTYLAAGKTEGV